MDMKYLLCIFTMVIEFGGLKSAEIPFEKDMIAEISEAGKIYSTKLGSCQLKAEDLRGLPVKVQKGERGVPGFDGIPGEEGPQGPRGHRGATGQKGDKGDPGEEGEQGLDGVQGLKGDRGSMGISGSPGLDGTCMHICPEPARPTSYGKAPEGKGGYGTIYEPSTRLCHILLNETHTIKDTIFVNPDNPFEVKCDKDTHMTCLQIKPMEKYDGKDAIVINETEPFWLSDRLFDLKAFYHNLLDNIIWLQQRSTQVKQVIRYHCRNSYVNDKPETALILLGWNDLAIGPYKSDYSPMTYTPAKDKECTSDTPKTDWRYTDILIQSKIVSRLPIQDFRIRDIRNEDQRFFLELVELCFG